MTDTNRDAHAVSGVSDAAVEAAARAMCAYDEPDETAAHWDQWHEAYTVAARTALTAALPHLAQPTDEAERWEPIDGDTKCQRCHQANVCWFADSTLWNQIMRDEDGVDEFGIVCLRCFGDLCEARMPAPVLHLSLETSAQSSGRGDIDWRAVTDRVLAQQFTDDDGNDVGTMPGGHAHAAVALVRAAVEGAPGYEHFRIQPSGQGGDHAREAINGISSMIDASYPPGLGAESHRWRRCMKVAEEVGEVTEALLGMVGENPRKGTTHGIEDLHVELLDVALAALGAVAYLEGNAGDPVLALTNHAATVLDRLRAALVADEGQGR